MVGETRVLDYCLFKTQSHTQFYNMPSAQIKQEGCEWLQAMEMALFFFKFIFLLFVFMTKCFAFYFFFVICGFSVVLMKQWCVFYQFFYWCNEFPALAAEF